MTPAKVQNITSRNHKLERLKSRMEKTSDDFILEIQKFVTSWFPEHVNKYIDLFPEIEENKTEDELKTIRRQAKLISIEAAVNIKNLFDDDKLWWHRNQSFHQKDFYKDIDDVIPEEVRFEFGKLGILLNSHDFLPMMVTPFHGFISGKDGENELYFKYLNPIHWSRDCKRLFDNYWEDYKWAIKLASNPN